MTTNVNAKELNIYFYSNGGVVKSSEFVENDEHHFITLGDGEKTYFASYESGETINKVNTINNKEIVLEKSGTSLVKGREWYLKTGYDNKIYFFNQSKKYNVNAVIEQLGIDENDVLSIELYANWKDSEVTGGTDILTDKQKKKATPKKITITYNSNGGSKCKKSSFKVKLPGKYPKKLCVPTKKGYVFSGWYTKKRNGEKVENNANITQNSDHSLYAYWRKTNGSVYFLNSNETSESVLIRSDNGHYMILDAAYDNPKGTCDNLIKDIKEIIKNNNDSEKIDYLVISHFHSDHYGCVNDFINNLNIEKVLLKGYTEERKKKVSSLTNYKGEIIDTLNNSIKSGNYLTYPLGNGTKVHVFNYKDVFKKYKKKCEGKITTLIFESINKNSDFTYRLSDGNGNYYYLDGINSKYLKKAKKEDILKLLDNPYDKDGVYRYYLPFSDYRPPCNENTNSLALLVEFTTEKGPRYVYLPSDLGNNGYSFFGSKFKKGKYSGTVTDSGTSFSVSLKNKKEYVDNEENRNDKDRIKNPILDTTSKKRKNETVYYFKDNNSVKVPAEANVAIQVKKKVGDSKKIVVYQLSHHGFNNDLFSINTLGINNSNTYFVGSNSNWSGKLLSAVVNRTNYYASDKVMENYHFTFTSSDQIIKNSMGNAIVANVYGDGTAQVIGLYYYCEDTKSCKKNPQRGELE